MDVGTVVAGRSRSRGSSIGGERSRGEIVFDHRPRGVDAFEAIDLQPNLPTAAAAKQIQCREDTKRSGRFFRWSLDILVGLVVGAVVVAVSAGYDFMSRLRLTAVQHAIDSGGYLQGWLYNVLIVLGYCAVAAALVTWRPSNAGSGIPGVIAFLNGVEVRHLLTTSDLFVKATGVMLAVGAGLAVGPEGPMV